MARINELLEEYCVKSEQLENARDVLANFSNIGMPTITEIYPPQGLESDVEMAVHEALSQISKIKVGNFTKVDLDTKSLANWFALQEKNRITLEETRHQLIKIIDEAILSIENNCRVYADSTISSTKKLITVYEENLTQAVALPQELWKLQLKINQKHPFYRKLKNYGEVTNYRHHLDIPENIQGVYGVFAGELKYIGSSRDVRRRLMSHEYYQAGQHHITVADLFPNYDLLETEYKLIKEYKPEWNNSGKGF